MRELIEIQAADIVPSIEQVLQGQGIPTKAKVNSKTAELVREAIAGFLRLASPSGVIAKISQDDFMSVFKGEGNNAEHTPLDNVFSSADSLALFAVTIGKTICKEIRRLFDCTDYAQGAMLDSAASEGTQRLADEIETRFRRYLMKNKRLNQLQTTMQFSPGYCGWHISAQRKLFEILKPQEIDINLSDSCLMQPLKSISGVIVAGKREIFDFKDNYEICGDCRTHSCRERIATAQKR